MDGILKSRKAGSFTARRQKVEQRRRQEEQGYFNRPERRQYPMTPELASDSSGDESDAYYSQDDTSTETCSDYSLLTPEELSSPKMDKMNIRPGTAERIYMPPARSSSTIKKQSDKGTIKPHQPSNPVPKMLATLTTTSDISYDRFSLIIDPSQIPDYEIEVSDESSSEDDDITDSPVETAKFIMYSTPKARQAIILISNYQSTKIQDTKKTTLSQDMTIQRQDSTRSTVSNIREGSHATEASLLEPNAKVRATSPALSCRPDAQEPSSRVPKRKSSMPLLFSNSKSGQSKLSSFRNLIRSSTTTSVTSTSQLGNIQEEKSKQNFVEERREAVRRSMTDPVAIQRQIDLIRPQTARPSSKDFAAEVATALLSSPLPSPSFPGSETPSVAMEQSLAARRKSFSKLRQRSGSIGQALRFSKSPDTTNLPPLPTLRIPSSASTNDLGRFSSPPPISPRDPRRSMANYSVFPTSEHRSSDGSLEPRKPQRV